MNHTDNEYFDLRYLLIQFSDYINSIPNTKKNGMPLFKDLIHSYVDKLSTTDFDEPFIENGKQHYERIYFFDAGGFIKPLWKVEKLIEIIHANNLPVTKISTVEAYEAVVKESIAKESISLGNGPVIIAEIPFCPTGFFVLDGNHRITNRYKKGFEYTPAYNMPFELHIRAIPSRYIQTAVSVIFNISCINAYLTDYLTLSECKSKLIDIL